jgi:hypothetical protein
MGTGLGVVVSPRENLDLMASVIVVVMDEDAVVEDVVAFAVAAPC